MKPIFFILLVVGLTGCDKFDASKIVDKAEQKWHDLKKATTATGVEGITYGMTSAEVTAQLGSRLISRNASQITANCRGSDKAEAVYSFTFQDDKLIIVQKQ